MSDGVWHGWCSGESIWPSRLFPCIFYVVDFVSIELLIWVTFQSNNLGSLCCERWFLRTFFFVFFLPLPSICLSNFILNRGGALWNSTTKIMCFCWIIDRGYTILLNRMNLACWACLLFFIYKFVVFWLHKDVLQDIKKSFVIQSSAAVPAKKIKINKVVLQKENTLQYNINFCIV